MAKMEELEKRIVMLEKELKETKQLQQQVGIKNLNQKDLDLSNGKLIIPNKAPSGRGKRGELRYNGSLVYVYNGSGWVALT